MSVPMKNGGMSKTKAVILTLLSGITTGIGAFFRSNSRRNIRNSNSNMPIIRSRSNALYCFRRTNPRIQPNLQRQNGNSRQHIRICSRNTSHAVVGDVSNQCQMDVLNGKRNVLFNTSI